MRRSWSLDSEWEVYWNNTVFDKNSNWLLPPDPFKTPKTLLDLSCKKLADSVTLCDNLEEFVKCCPDFISEAFAPFLSGRQLQRYLELKGGLEAALSQCLKIGDGQRLLIKVVSELNNNDISPDCEKKIVQDVDRLISKKDLPIRVKRIMCDVGAVEPNALYKRMIGEFHIENKLTASMLLKRVPCHWDLATSLGNQKRYLCNFYNFDSAFRYKYKYLQEGKYSLPAYAELCVKAGSRNNHHIAFAYAVGILSWIKEKPPKRTDQIAIVDISEQLIYTLSALHFPFSVTKTCLRLFRVALDWTLGGDSPTTVVPAAAFRFFIACQRVFMLYGLYKQEHELFNYFTSYSGITKLNSFFKASTIIHIQSQLNLLADLALDKFANDHLHQKCFGKCLEKKSVKNLHVFIHRLEEQINCLAHNIYNPLDFITSLALTWLQVIRIFYSVFEISSETKIVHQVAYQNQKYKSVEFTCPEIDVTAVLYHLAYEGWQFSPFYDNTLAKILTKLESPQNVFLEKLYGSHKALGSAYSASIYTFILALAPKIKKSVSCAYKMLIDKALIEYETLTDNRHYRCHSLHKLQHCLSFDLECLHTGLSILVNICGTQIPKSPQTDNLSDIEKVRLVFNNPMKYPKVYQKCQTHQRLTKERCRKSAHLICPNYEFAPVIDILSAVSLQPEFKMRTTIPKFSDMARARAKQLAPAKNKYSESSPKNFQKFLVDFFTAYPKETGKLLFRGLQSIESFRDYPTCF
jgi:hypothetical protein